MAFLEWSKLAYTLFDHRAAPAKSLILTLDISRRGQLHNSTATGSGIGETRRSIFTVEISRNLQKNSEIYITR